MKMIVIGAGNWGTTLACLFSIKVPVSLWTKNTDRAEQIQASRENETYLKGIPLPEAVRVLPKFSEPIGEISQLG